MGQNIFPFFKSAYSIGRSILTLEHPDNVEDSGPDSVFSLAKSRPDDRHFLVEDSISGIMEALVNAEKTKTKLTFGLRLTHLEDAKDKSEDSLKKESKIVILMNGPKAYEDLVRISTLAAKDGFYYQPRVDDSMLKSVGVGNLSLVVPFYDSYIHRNNLESATCVPSFLNLFNEVFYAKEDNDLPLDVLISGLVDKTVQGSSNASLIQTQSIYYGTSDDYLAYLSFRCIHNRTALQKPNLDHMSSDSFSFENYESKT